MTECPADTATDGMVRIGADLGSLGTFFTTGVLVRMLSTTDSSTIGNYQQKDNGSVKP